MLVKMKTGINSNTAWLINDDIRNYVLIPDFFVKLMRRRAIGSPANINDGDKPF